MVHNSPDPPWRMRSANPLSSENGIKCFSSGLQKIHILNAKKIEKEMRRRWAGLFSLIESSHFQTSEMWGERGMSMSWWCRFRLNSHTGKIRDTNPPAQVHKRFTQRAETLHLHYVCLDAAGKVSHYAAMKKKGVNSLDSGVYDSNIISTWINTSHTYSSVYRYMYF